MAHISSGASSKPQSYHKAHLLGELVEVKKQLVHKEEKISQFVKRLQRLEEAQVRQTQEEEDHILLPNGTINTNHNHHILLLL